MLVVFGALGVLGAIKMGLGARKSAELYIKKADWDWKNGPPRFEKHENIDEVAHGKEYISRDEFEMYDLIKMMSFCFLFVAFNALIMGKCGLRLVKHQKAGLARRMLKKGIFFTVLLSLVMFTGKRGKHMKEIIDRNKTPKNETASVSIIGLQAINEFEMADEFEIPEERPNKWGKKHHHNRKSRFNLTDEDLSSDFNRTSRQHHKYHNWDGRKEAYAMFAPKLWDKAKNETASDDEPILGFEGPQFEGKHKWSKHHKFNGERFGGETKKEKESKHEEKKKCCGVCPLKVILLITMIGHLYNIKCVKDTLDQKEQRRATLKVPVEQMKAAQAQVKVHYIPEIQTYSPQFVFAPAPVPEQMSVSRDIPVINYAINEPLVADEEQEIDLDKSED